MINEKLREARRAKGLTQGELADRLGGLPCDATTVSRWERGIVTPSSHYRQKLCEVLEKTPEELGIIPPPRTPKPSTEDLINLPVRLPRLIGREGAIDEVCDWLQHPETHPDTRLLTLTGVTGIGKTSLAEKVISVLHENHVFAEVCFVRLENINEKGNEAIVSAIARELKLEATGAPTLLDCLITYLHGKKNFLLVLNNCERLIQECAELARRLLRSCQHLTLLATSTERLLIKEESLYPVEALLCPDIHHLPPVECLKEYSAVELFETCRQKIDPKFTITDHNASGVVQICTRLDGHPLAISLLAGAQSLSEQQIVKRLDNCLPLLVGGIRTDTKRHETMKKTIEFVYKLLPKGEKILLQRLSVFRGGWTSEIAEMVCAGDGLEKENIYEMLESLIRKSLIQVEKDGLTVTARLLETIRQFAHLKLDDTGKAEAIHDRHLFVYMKLIYEKKPEKLLISPEQEAVIRYSLRETEYDNLQTALNWCIERQYYDILPGFVARLWKYWDENGCSAQAHDCITKALEIVDGTKPTPEYAEILWGAASLAFRDSDDERGSLLYDKSVAVYRALDAEKYSELLQARSLEVILTKAFVALMNKNYAKARTLYEQSLQQHKKQDNKKGEADCLLKIGSTYLLERDYARALTFFKTSLTLYRCLADTDGIVQSLETMGKTMLNLGNYKKGVACLKLSSELCFRLDNELYILSGLHILTALAYLEGRLEQVVTLYASSVALVDNMFTLERKASMASREMSGITSDSVITMDEIRKELGEQAFNEFVIKGYSMSPQEAVAYARTHIINYIEPEGGSQNKSSNTIHAPLQA